MSPIFDSGEIALLYMQDLNLLILKNKYRINQKNLAFKGKSKANSKK